MQTTNALKVGVAIVLAALILIFGVRFLQNVPFSGTYDLYTEFNRVDGLIKGNKVQINGVDIGSITNVALDQETQRVRIDMRINNGILIPEGTTAEQTGISAFGTVQVVFNLGPSDNPPIEDGGFVPSAEEGDLFTNLVSRVDSTLIGTSDTFREIAGMLREPTSDLRATLASVNRLTETLATLIETERSSVAALLASANRTSVQLDTLARTTTDSLGAVTGSLNQTLAEVQATLARLQGTTEALNRLTTRIDSGEGSLGRLVNDPGLYQNLDSTLVNLNRLLVDFRTNPKRYLRELKVVDVL